jgi:hypothetical protein
MPSLESLLHARTQMGHIPLLKSRRSVHVQTRFEGAMAAAIATRTTVNAIGSSLTKGMTLSCKVFTPMTEGEIIARVLVSRHMLSDFPCLIT